MTKGRHVHIISGGASVGDTYPKIILQLQGITDTIIISNSLENIKKEEDKLSIQKGYQEVEELSKKLGIIYHEPVFYKSNSIHGIIEEVINVFQKFQTKEGEVSYSFNITGGTKIQALALSRVADFMDAPIYYVNQNSYDNESEVELLSQCRIPVYEISKNPNIPILLGIINESGTISGPELKRKMDEKYIPVRNSKNGEKSAKVRQSMPRGVLSSMLEKLVEWNLIEQGNNNKRDKFYKIRFEGKIKLKLYQINPVADRK